MGHESETSAEDEAKESTYVKEINKRIITTRGSFVRAES